MKLKFTDESWAVFNLHVNDAGKRALKLVRRRYGADDPAVGKLNYDYKHGIMAIFKRSPDQATQMFATLCWLFANGLEGRRP